MRSIRGKTKWIYETRKLEVSEISAGCMSISASYASRRQEPGIEFVRATKGVTFFDAPGLRPIHERTSSEKRSHLSARRSSLRPSLVLTSKPAVSTADPTTSESGEASLKRLRTDRIVSITSTGSIPSADRR